ncbi:MAG: acyl-ACP--UDP-N-acetylglucosamine O-acyltransferase [Gammaproteobacteria bacterium]|nr:acyl-ACP--UDP-N-acetylglucosamine O-acyltransferase [Gammaproteobacteria bacterium]
MSNTIHSSAVISPKARLGQGNTIAPFVVIEDDVILGDNNDLHTGVVLKDGCRLGSNNSLHEYTVLGGIPQDLGYTDMQSFVEIGNDNVLREYVTINRASKAEKSTRIGDHNFLMTQTHLGHDCQLGDRVITAPGAGLGGHVKVADRAFISGGVMVHQFVQIGTLAMIGGNTKITQDVLPFMITDGVPGRVHGLNLVGLRRAGFSREDIRNLKQAYTLLFRSGQSLADILGQLADFESEYIAQLADFIRDSGRGFHRE